MSDATPEPFDPPSVHCRHLLVCRGFWYDPGKPGGKHSLGQMVVNLHNPDGSDDPFVEPRLFVCCQLFGTVGDYNLRIVFAEVLADENGDETERAVKRWGPWLVPVTDLDLVETHGLLLPRVPFDGPGVYEFQLWADGFDAPLAAERVAVPNVTRELP